MDVRCALISIILSVLVISVVLHTIHVENQHQLHQEVDEKYSSVPDGSYIRHMLTINRTANETPYELMKRCSELRFTSQDGVPVDIDSMEVANDSVLVWVYMPKNTTTLVMYYGSEKNSAV